MAGPDPLHGGLPPLRRPPDFAAFWAATVEELRSVPPALRREAVEDQGDGLVLEWLSFASLDGVRLHGYALRWTDAHARPLVIHSHGYGGQTRPMTAWARQGLDVVGVDVRGFGRSLDALMARSAWGWILTGSETPETSVLRGAVCDYLRAVEVGQRLVAPAPARTVLHGQSLAGGLALMAEALAPSADLLVLATPTFGWMEGRRLLVEIGSGAEVTRFLAAHPDYPERDLMAVLRYFDSANFAELVTCPTLVGLGLLDRVVPAATVATITAHLTCPHEVRYLPTSHAEPSEMTAWASFDRYWLGLTARRLPAGFGR
jgi:cephalosporin-C deacetylase